MAVEGLRDAPAKRGGARRSKGTAFLVSAGVMYEIIAAACSSPQTTELNAKARSATLMKWVNVGVAQGVLFVVLAAMYEDNADIKGAILSGGGLAGVLLYAQYVYARNAGLDSDEPPTETYQHSVNGTGSAVRGRVR